MMSLVTFSNTPIQIFNPQTATDCTESRPVSISLSVCVCVRRCDLLHSVCHLTVHMLRLHQIWNEDIFQTRVAIRLIYGERETNLARKRFFFRRFLLFVFQFEEDSACKK